MAMQRNNNEHSGMLKGRKISWGWIQKEVERKNVALKAERSYPLLYKYLAGKASKIVFLIAALIFIWKIFLKSLLTTIFDHIFALF